MLVAVSVAEEPSLETLMGFAAGYVVGNWWLVPTTDKLWDPT